MIERPRLRAAVATALTRVPETFKVLRVLADRTPLPCRFLVLGSAAPSLLRQASETLAGRIQVIEVVPLPVLAE